MGKQLQVQSQKCSLEPPCASRTPSPAAASPPLAPSSTRLTTTPRVREAAFPSTRSRDGSPLDIGDSWVWASVCPSALLSGKHTRTSKGLYHRLVGSMVSLRGWL